MAFIVSASEVPHCYCDPYPVSNDAWRTTTASRLIERLTSIKADPDESAALVVGAGTLPFTLDLLPPSIIVADLYQSVADGVRDRCATVSRLGSWAAYLNHYAHDAAVTTEFGSMLRAGLVRDIGRARTAAERANIVPAIGNVIATAPDVLDDAAMRGKQLTFINFTNAAQYLRAGRDYTQKGGRAALASLLNELPVHEQAVVCDSTFGLEATLYTPEQYSAFA